MSDIKLIEHPFEQQYFSSESWAFFKNIIGNDAHYNQFERLLLDEQMHADHVSYLVPLPNEQDSYLMFVRFPYTMQGAYKITLPTDPKIFPTISQRLILSSNVIDAIKTSSGVWLLTGGANFRRGVGYEEYSLISLSDPMNYLLLASVNFLSESQASRPIQEIISQLNVNDIGHLLGYKIINDGILVKLAIRPLHLQDYTNHCYFAEAISDGFSLSSIDENNCGEISSTDNTKPKNH